MCKQAVCRVLNCSSFVSLLVLCSVSLFFCSLNVSFSPFIIFFFIFALQVQEIGFPLLFHSTLSAYLQILLLLSLLLFFSTLCVCVFSFATVTSADPHETSILKGQKTYTNLHKDGVFRQEQGLLPREAGVQQLQ